MKTNFNGQTQINFKRNSLLDSGYYGGYKPQSNRIPPVAYLVMACLVGFGFFCMRVLSVWGYSA